MLVIKKLMELRARPTFSLVQINEKNTAHTFEIKMRLRSKARGTARLPLKLLVLLADKYNTVKDDAPICGQKPTCIRQKRGIL